MAANAIARRGADSSDIDPFSPAYILAPYRYHQELREAGPLVWLDRWNVYLAPRYGEVHAIVADPATFSSAAGVGPAGKFTRCRAADSTTCSCVTLPATESTQLGAR